MAEIGSVELERRRKREFYSDLEQYYRRKWNASLRIPCISGRPVDFHLLYQKVTALGGWAKVSSGNRWRDVVDSLDIPTDCAASEQAVKSIYMRYLAKYEQAQLFGENDGDNADCAGSNINGRSQRGRLYLSSLSGHAGASACSRYASACLPDHIGSSAPAPSGSHVLEGPQLERLIKSLKSGLPNEVDFAINICTILSNPAKAGNTQASVRLNRSTVLVDLLLAHVGIFDSGASSYRQLHQDGWAQYTPGRDFESFWRHCLRDEDELVKTMLDSSGNAEYGTSTDHSLFSCLSLSPNELDTIIRRVEQVANILRNFSFEPDCRGALANSRAMIRYFLIAVNCWRAELQSLALDALSNVAVEINLDDIDPPLLQLLMKTLNRCLHSDDKLHVVRALETIGNLCRNERNEALLCEFLEPDVIRRMIALLSVKDIMMCVYLLECLYQMTELGRVPCQRLAEEPRAVDTLVQLVTVEAVSFGPNGLLGMKVVEYGLPTPHTAILPHPSVVTPTVHSSAASTSYGSPAASIVDTSKPAQPTPDLPIVQSAPPLSTTVQQPPPFLARPVRPVGVGDCLPHAAGSPSRLAAPVVKQQTPPVSPVKKQPLATTPKAKENSHTPGNVSATPSSNEALLQQSGTRHRGPAVTVHQDQHVEQLTMNWLRQNCGAEPSSRVSRGELYTSYVQDMRGLYDTMAVTVSVFTNFVRQMFPSCNVRQLEGAAINGGNGSGASAQPASCRSTLLEFDGLKFIRRNPARNALMSPSSSSCSSSSPPVSHLVAQHPLTQHILSTSCSPEKQGTSAAITGSPVLSRTPGDAASALRARSDSAGTLDSMYSVPGTPDSLSSGFSGTNSSTGVYGATNFSSVQQQQTSSPKAQRKSSKAGSKNKATCSVQGSASTVATSDSGLVNGSASNSETTESAAAAAVCHLEICHPAQEARAVIETGDTHEAKIVRVENTIAMVSSQFYVPGSTSDSPFSPSTSSPLVVNGAARRSADAVFNSDNSSGCDTAQAKESVQTAVPSTTTASPKKKSKKASSAKTLSLPVNGLVKPQLSNFEATYNSVISGDSSPGPDTEAIKQNVNQSVQSIQELLAGAEDTKAGKSEDGAVTTTPVKKTKKGSAGKRKTSLSMDETTGEEKSEKPPQKKKKYYPKKKKSTDTDAPAVASPRKRNDSCSRASASSPHSSNMSSASIASAPFRLPLPPTGNQSQCVLQQTVVAPSANSTNSTQVIVRIPPPTADQLKYTCEWDNCGRSFGTSSAVYYHVSQHHINDETRICRWPHCDPTSRQRWSLVAHVQDVHCSEPASRASAIRRYELSVCGFTNVPEPRPPPPHPGYPPDAAIVAIRRHAFVNLAKDIVDENEGPVTKSIRLTTSLILRNLARYSADGRRVLRKYEQLLVFLSFSRLESSPALAQCLAELNCSSVS